MIIYSAIQQRSHLKRLKRSIGKKKKKNPHPFFPCLHLIPPYYKIYRNELDGLLIKDIKFLYIFSTNYVCKNDITELRNCGKEANDNNEIYTNEYILIKFEYFFKF